VTRPLRPFDWLVKVPLGLVWFGVIAVLAIPVLLYMTALFHAVGWARGLRSGGGGSDDRGAPRSEAA
jgi:hypothetical protein